jgi:hypothetical protein
MPHPSAERWRRKAKEWGPGVRQGFRLATDGHSKIVSPSTTEFVTELNQAQSTRLATRPKIPLAPEHTQLENLSSGKFKLSWQPVNDPRVIGYDILKSVSPYSHLVGFAYRKQYKQIKTVNANVNSTDVTLDVAGGSFRVVAITEQLTSLPSQAAAIKEIKTLDIPGRVNIEESKALDKPLLVHRKRDDGSEFYYFYKTNSTFNQSVSEISFDVNVTKTGWYQVNYNGMTYLKGEHFKLWQGNKLLGSIDFDPDIDDKSSSRHKVFIEKGKHELQLSVVRTDFDKWGLAWLEFTEAEK